jgi:hypothetical protein
MAWLRIPLALALPSQPGIYLYPRIIRLLLEGKEEENHAGKRTKEKGSALVHSPLFKLKHIKS